MLQKCLTRTKGSVGGSNSFTLDDDSEFFHDEVDWKLQNGEDVDESLSVRDYPAERLSPKAHMVAAHTQHYHTKEGIVSKEKKAYQRSRVDTIDDEIQWKCLRVKT